MSTDEHPQQPMTLGMRLDAALDSLDSLSSTQLYIFVVAALVATAFTVVAAHPDEFMATEEEAAQLQQQKNVKSNNNKMKKPRWHGILRAFNVTAIASFVVSVAVFFNKASVHSLDGTTLFRFVLGWSAFLSYFFSFSGVSLLYDSIHHDTAAPTIAANKQPGSQAHTSKKVQPAAMSAPACSDPPSFQASGHVPESTASNIREMKDADIADMVLKNQLKDHELEKRLEDCHRAVKVRRMVVGSKLKDLGKDGALDALPYQHRDVLDYNRVHGANCEIVVGYVPVPVGMVGPMTLNGETVFIPMATTEGCLVASTNRGAKAITQGGGAVAEIVRDGITRAPCVRLPTARAAAQLKIWCEQAANFAILKTAFESTTSFGKLQSCAPTVAGKNVYLRLTCFSGDAMGMNMISKGSLAVIEALKKEFPDVELIALSGNMCTDKKAAATNWIEGRGKSVVVEAVVPADVVSKTLKTTVQAIVHTNIQKNLIGSAMAGAMGGFNAHAANMVTAVFLATGQDPAQNVESSNCITLLEETEEGDLWISCTMPSLEVGTVGGGTSLPAQAACLKAIGCQGGGSVKPGENAQQLAKVIAAATMAGELSLLAALAANTLVAAHMQHNRKAPITPQK